MTVLLSDNPPKLKKPLGILGGEGQNNGIQRKFNGFGTHLQTVRKNQNNDRNVVA